MGHRLQIGGFSGMTALLWLLTALLAGSIGWNLIQFAARKKRDASLAEISSKLRRIVANETSERLLLFTDDKYLQELVQDIEGVLSSSQKMAVRYARTEQSM